VALGNVAGTPFVGLPGNPAAAYVTALAVLRPLVLHLSGAEDTSPILTVRSGFARDKRQGRREYLRVCLRPGPGGGPEAVPAPGGALSGLSASDGLVELAEDLTAIHIGDDLPYRPHGDLG
jgi:molybdopterin molybdotransferase